MVEKLLSLLACVLTVTSLSAARAGSSERETAVSQAVFAQGRLWIVSNVGTLSSLDEGAATRVSAGVPGVVLRICVQMGRPTILTHTATDGRRWAVRRLNGAGWTTEATIVFEGHEFVSAMACDATGNTVVTSQRLITLQTGRETSLPLSGRLRNGFLRAVLATDDAIFIGRYAGEWGGGLDRVDRRTGVVTSIEGRLPAKYCRMPLDPACDPVNGIAPEPWKPGCVVAAIGLEHMSPRGRLADVCGDTVTELYRKPYGSAAPYSTLPFYGVQRVGDALRAIGADGLYSIDRFGVKRLGPLPKFRDIGGVAVSFAVPGVVVMSRDIGPRPPSASPAPMLVAR